MTISASDRVRAWRDLDAAVKRAEAELKKLKRQRDQAEEKVLGAFEREGVSQIRVDGKLSFLRRELLVSPKAGQAPKIAQWMQGNGLGDLVSAPTVNSRTLGSFVREQIRDGNGIPPDLVPLIHVHEQFRVRATRGAA